MRNLSLGGCSASQRNGSMLTMDVRRSKHIRLIVPLFLLTWFVGCLLETGDLGSMDAGFRLQVAHSLWTSDPQVDPADFDQSFPIGRDGRPQAPWGIGQSLVMLPADIATSAVVSFLALPETLASKVRAAVSRLSHVSADLCRCGGIWGSCSAPPWIFGRSIHSWRDCALLLHITFSLYPNPPGKQLARCFSF